MISKKEAMGPRGQGIGRGVRERLASGVLSSDPVRDAVYTRILDQNASPEWQMSVLEALDEVPLEHLEGLRAVSPLVWGPTTWKDSGYYFESRGSDISAVGLYSSGSKTIAVHPLTSHITGKRTTLHEVGHHQDYIRRTPDFSKTYDRDYAWTRNQVSHEVVPVFRGLNEYDMARMGMTSYGKRNIGEFMSEAYEVRYSGTTEQWAALSSFVDSHTGLASTGTPPFSGIFDTG